MKIEKIVGFLDEMYNLNLVDIVDISCSKRVNTIHKAILNDVEPVFKKRCNGLCFQNGKEIREIYFSCFLSDFLVDWLREADVSEAMIITHHMFDIDAGEPGGYEAKGYSFVSLESYQWLKKSNISVYVLHLPLDMNANSINTHKALCNKLGLSPIKDLLNYEGYRMGYIAKSTANLYSSVKVGFKRFINLGRPLPLEGDLVGQTVSVVAGMISSTSMIDVIAESGTALCICGDVLLRTNTERMKNMENHIRVSHFPFLCISHQWTEVPVLLELKNVLQIQFPDIHMHVVMGEDRWK